jgi:hypothetical protein
VTEPDPATPVVLQATGVGALSASLVLLLLVWGLGAAVLGMVAAFGVAMAAIGLSAAGR